MRNALNGAKAGIYPVPQWFIALALIFWPARVLRVVRFPPGVRLPARAIATWRERPDLQAKFDLSRASGRRGLLRWFLFSSHVETGAAADAADQLCLVSLHRAYPGLRQRSCLPISWLMREIGRRDRTESFEFDTAEQQERFLSWIFRKGLAKYGLDVLLTVNQAEILLAPITGRDRVPRIVMWLWDAEESLRQRFSNPEDPALSGWLRTHGAAICPILAHPLIGLADDRRRPCDLTLPFGVNLVGHAKGRFGIGEDVRMAAKALASVDVPFIIRNLPTGDALGAEDDSVLHHFSESLPYAVTMFCTTGMETVRAISTLGRQVVDGRFTIGFWPWELPEWPAYLHHAYDNMDEVWASSRYTYDAYARSAPVPVRTMPMAVSTEEGEGADRGSFGLPADRFLFAFAYDGLSHATRKNPEACLKAFDLAFPNGNERVGLVIKGLRAEDSPVWRAIEARAANDPRLFLMTESWPRARLMDFYRAIDCFVSLHRAEGFGRNIAECMALGKPVIVTAHSGNMDFTDHASAALVPVRLRELQPGDYPHGTHQQWAEPDVEAAARHMRRMLEDERWRDSLAREARRRITAQYDANVVGRAWLEALQPLRQRLQPDAKIANSLPAIR
ncbi:MAG: glycosyltransferase family 4 protein [Sphingomonadales bacterium]|nr:glycosyltransferase family 4 protein [Sphingomonadales bacterium]